MIVPVDRLFRQLWDEDAVLSLKLTEGLSRDAVRPSQAILRLTRFRTAQETSSCLRRQLKNSGALSASWSRPVVGRGWHLHRHRVRELNCWSPLTTANRDSYGPAQARLDNSGSTFGGCTPPQPPTVDPPTAPPRRVFCCPTPRPRPKAALPKRPKGSHRGRVRPASASGPNPRSA